jgi:hypothetical protein
MISAEQARKLCSPDYQSVVWQLDNWFEHVGRRIEDAARSGRTSVMLYASDLDCRLRLEDVAATLERHLGYRVGWVKDGESLQVEW